MACDKPNGDCTKVSSCGGGCSGCGGGGGSGETPVLPRCQDVSLPPGVYPLATVVVNEAGCISGIEVGDPPLYTPNDCCGDGEGGNGTGGRGEKGDPGQAATIDVIETILTGTDNVWTVENIGTSAAAVLQFTAPANATPGQTVSGTTGEVCGLEVENGLVKMLPTDLITGLDVEIEGDSAGLVIAGFAPGGVHDPCTTVLTMNFDAFYNDLKTYIESAITENATAIQEGRIGTDCCARVFYNGKSSSATFIVCDPNGTEVESIVVPANSTATYSLDSYTIDGIYKVYVSGALVGVIRGSPPGGA